MALQCSPDGTGRGRLLTGERDPFHHALSTAARVWVAHPDADHLLAPQQADELAGRLDDLLQSRPTDAFADSDDALQHDLAHKAARLAYAGSYAG